MAKTPNLYVRLIAGFFLLVMVGMIALSIASRKDVTPMGVASPYVGASDGSSSFVEYEDLSDQGIDDLPRSSVKATYVQLSKSIFQVGVQGTEESISINTDGRDVRVSRPKRNLRRPVAEDELMNADLIGPNSNGGYRDVEFAEIRGLTTKGFRLVVPENTGTRRMETICIHVDGMTSVITVFQKGVCYMCKGQKRIDCNMCNGQGSIRMPSGTYHCEACMYTGKIQCFICGGVGED